MAEVALMLLAANLALAGELCGQAEAVSIVMVDFWKRPVEFHYYVSSGHGATVSRGAELKLASRGEYLVYVARPLERGGVYMAAADWRELAIRFREKTVCVSGFDAHRLEDGVLTVYVYGDGVTYQEIAAAAVTIPTLLAVMYLVERRYKRLHGWILKRLAPSRLIGEIPSRRPPRLNSTTTCPTVSPDVDSGR